MPTTAELAAKLRRLSEADENLRVFGAEDHEYVSLPIAPDVLDEFEAGLGVALPGAYREFLAQVGYGAGPDYGLLDLGALTSGGRRDPAGVFPFEATGVPRTAHASAASPPERNADWLSPGCVIIGEQGHEGYTALVTTGKLTGTIWDVSAEYEHWSSKLQNFDSWYDDWLTRALIKMGA